MSTLHLKNCRIVDVEMKEIIQGNLAIRDGRFVSTEDAGIPDDVLDLDGDLVVPGLVDGHLHIESSMLAPLEFAREAMRHGTTSVFVDPHEIANVLGRQGVDLFIDQADLLPLTMNIGVPSCVPATPMETAGGVITAQDVRDYIKDRRVFGLAEMMNYPGIIHDLGDAREKVQVALDAGKVVDGHCPGLSGDELAIYIGNGNQDGRVRISSEHEATTPDEAIEKAGKGMFIMLRYGSASKDMATILPELCRRGVDLSQFALVSDDLTAGDLRRREHVDHLVRLAADIIEDVSGCSRQQALLEALAMATVNPARHFKTDVGTLKCGNLADAVVVDSLEGFNPKTVISRGRVVLRDGVPTEAVPEYDYAPYCKPLQIPGDLHERLAVPAPGSEARVRVIGARHATLLTDHEILTLPVVDGHVQTDPAHDVLKLVVIERHTGSGNVGVGFVTGFNMKRGALASTVAHDSHNLIVVGSDDEMILRAVKAQREMTGGGLVAVTEGQQASFPLPLGGLMSVEPLDRMLEQYQGLTPVLQELGCDAEAFAMLSFLALPVIPKLKLTDQGLVDVEQFKLIDLLV